MPAPTRAAVPPPRWWDRWRAWMVVTLLLLATLVPAVTDVGPVAPASAATCDGVWVVVDARNLGGSITTRCAPGSPGSGLAALEGAGHAYSFVPRIPGMVCTIDARPEPCNGAPADAYWSYWHAEAGGSWTYATRGAGSRTPPPGGVEGWRFGDGSAPPGAAPPAAAPAPSSGSLGAGDDSAATRDDDGAGAAAGSDRGGASSSGDQEPDRDRDSASGQRDGSSTDAEGPGSDSAPAGSSGDEDGVEGTSEDAGSAPSWRPDAVETGEWADPPQEAAPTPAAPGDGPEDDVARDLPDQDVADSTLAARRRGSGDSSVPVGALVAIGLLTGIGVLTARQRRLRSGGAL